MRLLLLSMTLLCAAGLMGEPAHAGHRASHDLLDAAARSAPAAGQRWATDAPLREGMQGIRIAVDALDHYEHGHMGPDQAVLLADKIEGHVRDMVAHCALAPDADAALHAIIAPLLQGAGALKRDPGNLTVIAPMRKAVADYARQFDDPAARQAK
ncbi:MAG TPA: DnrO protein [Lysobacter sp.]